jgi:hypothetical protein
MIWIITSSTPQEVGTWFPKRLAPDDIMDGFDASIIARESYTIPNGMRAVGAWYD